MNTFKNALLFAAKNFPKRHFLAIAGVSVGTALLLTLMPGESAQANRTEIPIDLSSPESAPSAGIVLPTTPADVATGISAETQPQLPTSGADKVAAQAAPATPVIAWQKTSVRSGDSLSALFSRHKLSPSTLHKLVNNTTHGKSLVDIRPGQTVMLGRIDGELTALKYVKNKLESLEFTKTEDGFTSQEVIREPEVRKAYASATIKNSLFLAATEAGLTDNMTMRLANIFGWDIDFVLDIREGDSFNLIYEEKYLDGEKIGYGDILAATFNNRDRKLEAVYFVDSTGDGNYYTPDGKSMRKSFIRTPVDFTRISSRFNPNRLHPVFKTKRPHRGVDYAAPTGTPIKAAGDGVIQFSGWKNGYGNVVYIKHANNIVTVYAHQVRTAGLRKGQRVKQGQTVGYVGQTGWATGPHLHYEFQVNGVHRNPLTVKLPDAAPLPKKEMANFQTLTKVMLAELERQSGTLLASAEEASNVTTQ
ncbi:OapA family protein [Parendozoicomonas haliclonae]|uniref:Murein DD-endopeptidase MepM n=1 Tax=Parendozoicomonas haliclonae TaxID=1960125 RepID=A0A1X7AF88_9GAMM|nr:peptidoglycan DD-metalloendopeptidase family protein [Parendozoicomonas haliclonae]SMA36982.1 Murein DD-endopeptidase MepM [Parendozoicomonas haliclonae]